LALLELGPDLLKPGPALQQRRLTVLKLDLQFHERAESLLQDLRARVDGIEASVDPGRQTGF